MKTLVLVDGSSYLYRAFHALPDLRNAKGEPTGAIYGVLNMLRRLVIDYKADFLGCVFDPKGKTFRDDIYPQYKATRTAMPDDLGVQIEPLYAAIRAMGWPLVVVDGVEADDVIGTLACRATREGIRTIVSTGDKDLAQLVDGHVELVNTMSNERLDSAGVNAKFGVPPERIVDYLTLVGDAVDNVPGVDKVGPKTAAKWLGQYGSLDAIVANADKIPGVVGDNLRKALEWLPTARTLVTVKTDLALPLGVHDLSPKNPDSQALAALFERFGFKTWLRELQGESPVRRGEGGSVGTMARGAGGDVATPPRPDPVFAKVERKYELLLTEEDVERWLPRLDACGLAGLDTETTSLDPFTARLVGVSFAVAPGEAAYLAIAHAYADAPDQLGIERALALLRPWLEDPAKKKVGQNIKYDQHVLANHGVRLAGIAHDTLLESYVLESHMRHDMDSLAERYLGEKTIGYDDVTGTGAKRIGFEQVEVQRAMEYSAEDADITLRLHHALYPRLAADESLERVYTTIEMPVREVLFKMERNGVLLDCGQLDAQSRELGQKMLALEERAYGEAGQPFNLNSPKQIGEIFFQQLKLPVVKKTSTGVPSTDEEVLEKLALDYPLPKLIKTRSKRQTMFERDEHIYELFEFIPGESYDGSLDATGDAGRLDR